MGHAAGLAERVTQHRNETVVWPCLAAPKLAASRDVEFTARQHVVAHAQGACPGLYADSLCRLEVCQLSQSCPTPRLLQTRQKLCRQLHRSQGPRLAHDESLGRVRDHAMSHVAAFGSRFCSNSMDCCRCSINVYLQSTVTSLVCARRAQAKADGPPGLSPSLLERMDECSRALSKTRKKRVVSATLAPPEAVAELSLLAAQPLHKTSKVHSIHFAQSSWVDPTLTGFAAAQVSRDAVL